MAHKRIRCFNTKDTYPEQKLDNDLCQVVVARGTMVFVRGQIGQDLDTSENVGIGDVTAQAEQAMRNQDSSRFLAICRHILQQRFGFAWRVEPQAICAADLEQRLGNDSPLPEILTKAEHAAYTGEQLAPSEMEHILHIVQQEARQL